MINPIIPRKVGNITYIAHPRTGRRLGIKLVSRGNYYMRIEGTRRARWASSERQVREDVAEFLATDALPPARGAFAGLGATPAREAVVIAKLQAALDELGLATYADDLEPGPHLIGDLRRLHVDFSPTGHAYRHSDDDAETRADLARAARLVRAAINRLR